MSETKAAPVGYCLGDVYIDVGMRQVSRDRTVLQLPPLSYDLLLALVRRAPNAVSSGELMAEVWTGRVVNDETIAKRVELVREALGDDSRQSRYIALVRGHGYRVTADVQAVVGQASPAATPVAGAAPIAPAPVRSAAPSHRVRLWAIGAGALLAMAAVAILMLQRGAPAQPTHTPAVATASRISLAVLPLDDLSPDISAPYFAAGMHDALIADISKASAIKVISRTSTLPYRDSGKKLSEIATELGVNHVMEGSVMRANDRVRITVQLLDASDAHLWAENYEGDMRDVLKLQAQVARAVAQAVKVKLTPLENSRLSNGAVDVDSYELYLKGSELIGSPGEEGFDAGIALLTRATEIDPSNPLPFARLALAYGGRAHAPGAATSFYPRATSFALQAVGLDPDLAEAHEALAEMQLYFHWDWPAAEASFRKVFELNPSLAASHAHYGWFCLLRDDFKRGLAEMHLATELDPGDPLWRSWLGWLYLLDGNYSAAEKHTRAVLEKIPGYPVAHHVLGQTYLRLGRHDEALAAFQKAADASHLWSWGLGQGYAFAGRMAEARGVAARLERQPFPDAWGLAEVYAAIGDLDQAVKWVEKGYETRRDWLPWVEANTFLAPIHDHPRFREVIRRLDLPD